MLCLNTISSQPRKIQLLQDERCETLKAVAVEKEYVKRIVAIYPEWTCNKGMGYYFYKLNVELYGTPSPLSLLEIEELADVREIDLIGSDVPLISKF